MATFIRILLAASLGLLSLAHAHMLMSSPPALRYKENPHAGDDIDYDLVRPLAGSGSDYPCHGSLDLLGTSMAAPVANWQAGESYEMTVVGGINHDGGSCQASVSLDGGRTFTVIHSYVGGCPAGLEATMGFRLPADTPASESALFGWSWHNKLGNREMYMNCAVVTISEASTAGEGVGKKEIVLFEERPTIFEANIGNGCTTVDSTNVLYPNPGPDVDVNTDDAVPAVGNCEAPRSGGGDIGGGSVGSGRVIGSTFNSVKGSPVGDKRPVDPSSGSRYGIPWILFAVMVVVFEISMVIML